MSSEQRASFAFIAVMLLGVAIVGAVNIAQAPVAIAPTLSSAPCAHRYPSQISQRTTLSNGTQITELGYPALVIAPGSTMALCVDYDNGTYAGPVSSSASVWKTGGQLGATQEVNVSASPPDLYIAQGQTVGVEYGVAAGQDSKGFYGLSLMQLCVPVPLAVGYEPSQVNTTDFSRLFGVRFCAAQVLGAQIVGYTGGNTTYVSFESRVNLRVNITGGSVASFPTSGGAENATFTVGLHSFGEPLTVGLSSNQSSLLAFKVNPELTTSLPNDDCSWVSHDTSALNGMTVTAFQKEPGGSMQVHAPVLQLPEYSNATYTFSVLLSPRIASFTAMNVILYVNMPGSPEGYEVASYFPMSLSGQLQSISGECQPPSPGI